MLATRTQLAYLREFPCQLLPEAGFCNFSEGRGRKLWRSVQLRLKGLGQVFIGILGKEYSFGLRKTETEMCMIEKVNILSENNITNKKHYAVDSDSQSRKERGYDSSHSAVGLEFLLPGLPQVWQAMESKE